MNRTGTRLLSALALLTGLSFSAVKPASADVVLEKQSLYRNILISEDQGLRCMLFGRENGPRQSCIDIDNPQRLVLHYSQGFLLSLAFIEPPEHILVLGLGGGILPKTLRALYPQSWIDVAELDPAVIELAKSQFGFQEDARMRAYAADARVFVKAAIKKGGKYDLILLDAFDQDYIPEHLLTQEFLQEVKSLLPADGLVAANTFSRNKLAPYEAATYQSVFGDIDQLALPSGNRILFATQKPLPSKATLMEHVKVLKPRFAGYGFDAEAMAGSIEKVPEATVKPLTDQFSPSNLLQFQQ
ncbi:spermidine synthase [Pokkaliibacter sp. CJK22405]|uniref:spermidine synthase n=1 Tax=Pokkaliibacter sp. CJK22405 TaxID=3384615 RepID=UPI0039852349